MRRPSPRPAIVVLGALLALWPLIGAAQEPQAHGSGEAAVRTVYVVRAGDTLSGIAARFGSTVDALARENSIRNPSLISAGQQLSIPGTSTSQVGGAAPQPVAAPPAPVAVARPLGPFHSFDIGRSSLGAPLRVDCAGSGDRVALIVGGVHTGMEANTITLVSELQAAARTGRMTVPSGIWLCFLPALNVDGVALQLHTNAHAVDLNRNWPTANWLPTAYHPATGTVAAGIRPLSEPETHALYDFITEARPALVISYHCCAYLVEANAMPSARTVARRYAASTGAEYVEQWTAYRVTGDLIRALQAINVPAFDVELTHPGNPPVALHLAAVEAALAQLARP